MIKTPNKNEFVANLKLTAWMILSGCAVALSFSPLGWRPFALIAWFPLFYISRHGTARQSFYLGLLQGMIAYGLSLAWFWHIFHPAALVLYAIMALFIAFFCLLVNHFSPLINNLYLSALYTALLWTSIEYYRCEWFPLRFPWITPGVAMGPNILSPIIGVYGITFIIILGAALMVETRTRFIGVALCFTVGLTQFLHNIYVHPPANRSLRILLVQKEEGMTDDYIAMTDEAASFKPDLVIWPEYAIGSDIIRQTPEDYKIIHDMARNLHTILLLGDKTLRSKDGQSWSNTALMLDGNGVIGHYYKNRPVPFFDDGIPGTTQLPIACRFGKIGTPICYDNDCTEVDRRLVLNGARFLAAPSFDSMEWTPTQHLQHSMLFRIRAAENDRWIACAASSGVSQIIDPYGNVIASLPPMKEGILEGIVGLKNNLTFYTKYGWLFPWLAIVLSTVWSVILVFKNPKAG